MRQQRDKENVMMEMSSDALEFYKHPIKAYDPHYTRDFDNFRYNWSIYLKECKRLLIDYLQLSIDDPIEVDNQWTRYACVILNMTEDVINRVKGYERATGCSLLHRLNRHGNLVLGQSIIDLIRTTRS